MIDLARRFFGKSKGYTPSVREEEGTHDIRIATAALFLAMANIDGEFDSAERERILPMLKENFQLSDAHAAELLEASQAELKRSIDLWQFTNLINENYSLEEKVRIIEMIWEIIYIDGNLDSHEDYLVHKLAKLLRLNHKALIDAKLKVLHAES